MAFAQDILTRMVNVHWGGGAVFVMGDEAGQIFYSDGKGTGATAFPKVFQISSPGSAVVPPGQCFGASSALVAKDDVVVTAIVVGGLAWAAEEHGVFSIGRIVYSENGIAWQEALDMGGSLTEPTGVLKIIWDADRFYSLATRSDAEGNFTSECWSSADGKSWGLVSSNPGFPNSTFESHCKYNEGGVGLADGEFGIDPSKKESDETFPYGKVVEDGLLITRYDMNNCPVTFAGGTWGRADFTDSDVAELETSTDSGNTFSVVGHITAYDARPSSGSIRALIAAPAKPSAPSRQRNARL